MPDSKVSDDENGDTHVPGAPAQGGETVIVNGLLGSILKALSRDASKEELIMLIDSDTPEDEIKESWLKLFSFYNTAYCKQRKKEIVNIKRESSSAMVRDIVEQLCKKDVTENLKMFAIPWDYTVKEFLSDSEKQGRIF